MLSVPESIEGTPLFAHQDYMHLAWRLRVQLLNPKKEWEIGPGLRVGWAHLDSLVDSSGDKLLNRCSPDPAWNGQILAGLRPRKTTHAPWDIKINRI
jgi:hypothetical protein